MNENKIIKISKTGLYQVLVLILIVLINLGVFLPINYIAFISTPPYFIPNSQSLSEDLCEDNNSNFIIDAVKSKVNWYFNTNFAKLFNFSLETIYCSNSLFYLCLFVIFLFICFIFLLFFFVFKSKITFIVTCIISFSLTLVLNILSYTDTIKTDEIFVSIISFYLSGLFISFIFSKSIQIIMEINIIHNQRYMVAVLYSIPYNITFIILILAFLNDITQKNFKLIVIIIYSLLILFSIGFYFLSTENLKLASMNDGLLLESVKKIVKINNIIHKKDLNLLYEKIEERPPLRKPDRSYFVKAKEVLLFILMLVSNGVLFSYYTFSINDYAYKTNYFCLIFIGFSVAFTILTLYYDLFKYNWFKYTILSVLIILTLTQNFLSNVYVFYIIKIFVDLITSFTLFLSFSHFFFFNEKKYRLIMGILVLSFWQGVLIGPIFLLYIHNDYIPFAFSVIYILLIFLYDKNEKANLYSEFD